MRKTTDYVELQVLLGASHARWRENILATSYELRSGRDSMRYTSGRDSLTKLRLSRQHRANYYISLISTCQCAVLILLVHFEAVEPMLSNWDGRIVLRNFR